jgi:hypothetical protein
MKKLHYITFACVICAGGLFAQVTAQENNPAKGLFVGQATAYDQITDNDEKAAAYWFVNTYGGVYMPLASIETNTDISIYPVIWLYIDDPETSTYNNEAGEGNPETRLSDNEWMSYYNAHQTAFERIKTYYQNGGNLFTAQYANFLLHNYGRAPFYPFSDNPNRQNSWTTYEAGDISYDGAWGTVENSRPPEVIVRTGDRIYKDVPSWLITKANGIQYRAFAMLSPGSREAHECWWDLGGDKNAHLNFEKDNNCEVIGQLQGDNGYWRSGIVRWNPKGAIQGIAVAVDGSKFQTLQRFFEFVVSQYAKGA